MWHYNYIIVFIVFQLLLKKYNANSRTCTTKTYMPLQLAVAKSDATEILT